MSQFSSFHRNYFLQRVSPVGSHDVTRWTRGVINYVTYAPILLNVLPVSTEPYFMLLIAPVFTYAAAGQPGCSVHRGDYSVPAMHAGGICVRPALTSRSAWWETPARRLTSAHWFRRFNVQHERWTGVVLKTFLRLNSEGMGIKNVLLPSGQVTFIPVHHLVSLRPFKDRDPRSR